MAEKSIPVNVLSDGWKEGTLQVAPREARRKGPSSTAHPSGLLDFNVSATKAADKVARARGIQPEEGYVFKYYTNSQTGKLGLVPVKDSGPGTVGVNRYRSPSSTRISCHVGAAYLEEPDLQPVTKSRCMVTVENSPKDGLPMLSIALKAGTGMQTQSRSS